MIGIASLLSIISILPSGATLMLSPSDTYKLLSFLKTMDSLCFHSVILSWMTFSICSSLQRDKASG